MKLNEESFNQLNRVINKQYYFWLDDNDRLTLELTEEKTLRECAGITMDTMNKLMSVCPHEAAIESLLNERVEKAEAVLKDVITYAAPDGTQDGDFIGFYVLPTGPVHRALAYLDGKATTMGDVSVISQYQKHLNEREVAGRIDELKRFDTKWRAIGDVLYGEEDERNPDGSRVFYREVYPIQTNLIDNRIAELLDRKGGQSE